MRFQDKVVLITGGGRGIGRAAALRFAQEGANVAIADIRADAVEAVAGEVRASGHSALTIVADVADEDDNRRVLEETLAAFERLDVLFANAGITHDSTVQEMPVETWDEVIRVNLRGVFLSCKHAVPALIASRGAIVTMSSSMAGWDTLAGGAAYMASKEGVSGLTKSLALQLAGYGIRVNAVCPGVIQTRLGLEENGDEAALLTEAAWQAKYDAFANRIPLRRAGQPEDVAAAVAFLASDDARHITGSMLLIDGGQTLQSWSNAPDAGSYPLFDS